MSEFNLVYYHKETGKKYMAKRVTMHDYIIMDPETETKLPISRHFLKKSFRADKSNCNKKVRLNFRKTRKKSA